jgi:hypothetical protein
MDDSQYGHLTEAQRYALRQALDSGRPLVAVLDREVNDGALTPAEAYQVANELDPGAGARWWS